MTTRKFEMTSLSKIRITSVLERDALKSVGVFHPAMTWNGRGKCAKCSCQEFQGYGSQCSNCGHWFQDHESTGAGY